MAKGKTKSKLTYSERKETAFELFTRHWSNADIARKLDVTPETISNYKREWEKIQEESVWNDPNYLNRILEHTKSRVTELEQVMSHGWTAFEGTANENAKMAALRIIKDTIMDMAKLQRLTDTRIEIVNQAEKALQVQTILLEMINTVISDCPHCRHALAEKINEVTAIQEGRPEQLALTGEVIDI